MFTFLSSEMKTKLLNSFADDIITHFNNPTRDFEADEIFKVMAILIDEGANGSFINDELLLIADESGQYKLVEQLKKFGHSKNKAYEYRLHRKLREFYDKKCGVKDIIGLISSAISNGFTLERSTYPRNLVDFAFDEANHIDLFEKLLKAGLSPEKLLKEATERNRPDVLGLLNAQ